MGILMLLPCRQVTSISFFVRHKVTRCSVSRDALSGAKMGQVTSIFFPPCREHGGAEGGPGCHVGTHNGSMFLNVRFNGVTLSRIIDLLGLSLPVKTVCPR